jgi:3,4-dihydroxy 2-butanone 4-phosphate synthase/GTP cyclohydrolase II
LTKGTWNKDEEVLVRVNSTLINNDIIGTLMSNPDDKLGKMFDLINKEGKGAIVECPKE